MKAVFQENSIPFDDLCIRQYPLRKLRLGKNHLIHAIDTETYKGYARLITNDLGDSLLSDSIDDYLGFLTKSCFKTAHSFAYNLRYDAQAILKYLPNDLLKELWTTSKTKYKDYKIKYVPKKVLSITLHKNRYAFYDIAQFFNMSLAEASKKYLQKVKNPEFVDPVLLNTSKQYWKQNQEKIIRYCIIDSQLTQQLGQFLQSMLQKALNINPQNYVSVASLSKQYFRKKCVIPHIQKISRKVLMGAFNAYKGGRFEVLEKGNVGKCTLLDIKSAYSYEISKLIDVTKGDWLFTRKMNEEAYYGFYNIKLWVKWAHMLPIPFKRPIGVYCYPAGSWGTWITKQELLAYDPFIEYEIISGYEYYPKKIIYPFKEEILRCFNEKEKYDKSDFRYDLVKKIPNSLYGTFYEKHKTNKKWYTGKMFNPVYASIITANTRIKVFKKAIELKNPTVAFATDSIIVKGRTPNTLKGCIGDWEKEAYGDTIILKSGIYKIRNKVKTRGMSKKTKVDTPYGKYDSIFDYIQDKPTLVIYPIKLVRPVSLGESLIKTKILSPRDINVWRDFPYRVNINIDFKRYFKTSFESGLEIFTKNIDSEPFIVN